MISYEPLYRTMKERKITTYKLINEFGVSRSLLDRLKHNKPISTVTLNDLCRFLNCRVEDVLVYKDYLKNREIVKNTYLEYSNENDLNKKLAIDIKYWLPDNILNIVDKMTMAFSIESRVPFTDIEIFKIAKGLPREYKVRDKVTKVALREAAKRDIPNESYKKKKLGFPVPIREWIKDDDFYEEIRRTFDFEIVDELFNRNYIMKLLDDHKNGIRDNYRKVWAIYSFLKWYEVYFLNY